MPAVIRPELSKKNKYWVNRHRYYELKHFCLQYNAWKQLCSAMISLPAGVTSSRATEKKRATENMASERELYLSHIEMIDTAARETDDYLAPYILRGVTTGMSYQCLHTLYSIPCSRDVYYELYRKFFYILDGLRE